MEEIVQEIVVDEFGGADDDDIDDFVFSGDAVNPALMEELRRKRDEGKELDER